MLLMSASNITLTVVIQSASSLSAYKENKKDNVFTTLFLFPLKSFKRRHTTCVLGVLDDTSNL